MSPDESFVPYMTLPSILTSNVAYKDHLTPEAFPWASMLCPGHFQRQGIVPSIVLVGEFPSATMLCPARVLSTSRQIQSDSANSVCTSDKKFVEKQGAMCGQDLLQHTFLCTCSNIRDHIVTYNIRFRLACHILSFQVSASVSRSSVQYLCVSGSPLYSLRALPRWYVFIIYR